MEQVDRVVIEKVFNENSRFRKLYEEHELLRRNYSNWMTDLA